MRRIKQQLSDDECISILKSQKRGFLAVMGINGYPYNLPINYAYHDNSIVLHTSSEGQLPESIRSNNKASFAVIDDGKKASDDWYYIFNSVILFGDIKIIEDEKEKIDLLRVLGNKYYPSVEHTENVINKSAQKAVVYKLIIKDMAGKMVREK